MSTTVARLQAVLTADTHGFDKSMDQSHSKMGKVGKAAGLAGAAIIGGLAVGLHKSVEAAMEAQVSQERLDTAFKASHISIDKFRVPIENAVAASAKLGFQASDVRDSIGSLSIATHSGSKAITDLGVAEDIARFKHIDLTSASKMLTMAMSGSQRATKQLGLSVTAVTVEQTKASVAHKSAVEALKAQENAIKHLTDKQKEAFQAKKDEIDLEYRGAKASAQTLDHQATAAKVIALVTEKLHGQADAYAQTAAGAKEKFGAQMNLLQENLGKVLLPAITAITDAIARLTGFFVDHEQITKLVVAAVAALAGVMIAVSVAMKVYEAGVKVATAAQWLFNVALDANPISLIIIGLVAAGVAIYVFRDKIAGVVDWIKANWPRIVEILTGPIGVAVVEIAKHFGGIRKAVIGPLSDIIGAFQDLPGEIRHAISAPMTEIISSFKDLPQEMTAAISGGASKIAGAVSALFNSVKNTFSNIPGEVRSAINAAIGAISGFVDDAFGAAKRLGAAIAHGLSDGLDSALAGGGGVAKQFANAVIRAINDVITHINDLLKFTIKMPGPIPDIHVNPPDIPHIPQLAKGGPLGAGMPAIVGERGPELFVPTSSGTVVPNGGMGPQVAITVNGWVGGDQQLADKIVNELTRWDRRSGGRLGFA